MNDKEKLEKAIVALEYADLMCRLDLFHMTDYDDEDYSQAVFDTAQRISRTLKEIKE